MVVNTIKHIVFKLTSVCSVPFTDLHQEVLGRQQRFVRLCGKCCNGNPFQLEEKQQDFNYYSTVEPPGGSLRPILRYQSASAIRSSLKKSYCATFCANKSYFELLIIKVKSFFACAIFDHVDQNSIYCSLNNRSQDRIQTSTLPSKHTTLF